MSKDSKLFKREVEIRAEIVKKITGLGREAYFKHSGSIHIQKLAKDLNMDRKTLSKYLKKMGYL